MDSEAVIIKIKLSDDECGEPGEREAVYRVEDGLIDLFERSDVGGFDGHEFGGGFATLYIYGSSADAMAAAVMPLLQTRDHREGSVLIKRFGPPGAPQVAVSLAHA